MDKLPSLVLVLALACLGLTSCQTTGKPTQSEPTRNSPDATAQSPQSRAQSAQLAAQPQAPNPADSAVKAVSAVYSKGVAPAVSAQFNRMVRSPQVGNLVHKVDAFLVNRVDAFKKIRLKLFGVDLQTTELMAIIVAAVILLVGGSWTLAARRSARRGG
ncbi:MAG TPA: hypothetical protein VMU36_09560 [Spirochaetia bacterium]|nr:hypothetical protein [Spirochaetia bacterium]